MDDVTRTSSEQGLGLPGRGARNTQPGPKELPGHEHARLSEQPSASGPAVLQLAEIHDVSPTASVLSEEKATSCKQPVELLRGTGAANDAEACQQVLYSTRGENEPDEEPKVVGEPRVHEG